MALNTNLTASKHSVYYAWQQRSNSTQCITLCTLYRLHNTVHHVQHIVVHHLCNTWENTAKRHCINSFPLTRAHPSPVAIAGNCWHMMDRTSWSTSCDKDLTNGNSSCFTLGQRKDETPGHLLQADLAQNTRKQHKQKCKQRIGQQNRISHA